MEWSYNTSQHSGTGLTPYEVVYGKPPPSIHNYLRGSSHNEAVDAMLTTREEIYATLRRKLLKAQDTMKHYADRSRCEAQYEVDQLVYVKLRPYRQCSLRTQTSNKLAKRYFGPFRVLERVGNVAYRLQLPEGCQIHPVFHCSLLRSHHGPHDLQATPLPPAATHNNPILEPLAVLDSRMDTSSQPPRKLVLVQWKGMAPEESTWEDWADIHDSHHLEDKVTFPGEDIVRNVNNNDTSSNEARPRKATTRPRYLESYV